MATHARTYTTHSLLAVFAWWVAIFAVVLAISAIAKPSQTHAQLNGSDFQPGRIIDDAVFYNDSSMTISQIQQFLNARVPNCDTNGERQHWSGQTRAQWAAQSSTRDNPPYTCLKDYSENVPTITHSGSDLCKVSISGGNKSAARIIHDVGKACGINPQVLIVMLQKEQSLITDDWPWKIQYDRAMGYACPDSGPNNSANCDTSFYGFFNQVYNAAKAFRRYEANPTWYNYRANRNNSILYHPNTSCGRSNVFIENQATANLYIYTPYQPNQIALDNLYSTGDSCSAYGNRNFWRLFNDWFGSTRDSLNNIVPVIYDNSTDISGELASIGFRLTAKPKSKVSFRVQYDSTHASSAETTVTISPNDWNHPRKNLVILKGKYSSGFVGSITTYLTTGDLVSDDGSFRLSSNLTPDIPIIHSDLSNRVYRLFNSVTNSHTFTGSETEKDFLIDQGWRDEGTAFYGCNAGDITLARIQKENNHKLLPYRSDSYDAHIRNGFTLQSLVTTTSGQGKSTLYVKYRPSSRSMLYTLSEAEGNSAGFVTIDTMKSCHNNINPTFRLYSPTANNHFYTASTSERNTAREKHGYRYEGVAHYITTNGTTPVYRLFSPKQRNHFYTASISERDSATKNGFRYEGVAFRLNQIDVTSTYRLFSGSAGNHFYTNSLDEAKRVEASGYRLEGVGFRTY